MLQQWLGDTSVAEFQAAYLRRAPFAIPSTAHGARSMLDWDVLHDVLACEALDALVVARGALLPLPSPRSARMLEAYLEQGVGLCVRHAERHHDNLNVIASAIASAFPGAHAQVQLFVTPAKTYGFSWHYDDEDVFIVQTVGEKDYFFRENTVAANETAHGSRFERFVDERSPILTARLHPGDFLYIPSRWWHMAECLTNSLSISVGVTGATRQPKELP